MIAAVALGLLIGLALGALGGGGSILAVPVLVHLAGQSSTSATATSLVAVAVASAVGSVGHARKGNVRWGAAGGFVAAGVAGSWVGTRLNAGIDEHLLLLMFSGLVLLAAHRMLTACPSCTAVGETIAIAAEAAEAAEARTADARPTRSLDTGKVVRVLLAGTVAGLLTGLFGVGGGFVIVPALTLALGLNMPTAIATSLVVIVGNALVALSFRGLGAVDWDIALPFTATMVVGSALGAIVGPRLPVEASLRVFAAGLVMVAIGNGIAAAFGLFG